MLVLNNVNRGPFPASVVQDDAAGTAVRRYDVALGDSTTST